MAAWVNNQRLIGPGRARCCVVYTCLPLVTQMCGAPVYLYIFYNNILLPGEARLRHWVTGQGHLLVPIKDTLVDAQLKRCSCGKLLKDNEPFPTHGQQSGGRRAWIERRAKVALRPATAM